MHESIIERIRDEALIRGLKGCYHHRINEEQINGLGHIFSSTVFPNYCYGVDVEATKGLRAEFIRRDDVVISENWVDGTFRTKCWGTTHSISDYVSAFPQCADIKFEDVTFHLWNVARWSDYNSSDTHYDILSYRVEDIMKFEAFLRLISELAYNIRLRNKTIVVYGGPNVQLGTGMSWDDLVLDDAVIQSTKMDIEGWISAEE